MVEYAILLILLVTLFVGGTELGITALASNKNTEAAKTGISEYADVNQQRLNILNAEKQYLITLAGYGCSVIYLITNDYDETNEVYLKADGSPVTVGSVNISREILVADDNDSSCNRLTDDQIKAGITKENTEYDSLLELLDAIYNPEEDDYIGGNQYIIDDLLSSLYYLANALTSTENSPSQVLKSDKVDKNQDGVLTEEELLNGETFILDSSLQNVADDDKDAEGQLKFKALLLIAHYKLSLMPLDTATNPNLNEAKIAIGAHDDAGFSMPQCTETGYDEGFPDDRYIGREYYDNLGNKRFYSNGGSKVYLFNPLPINVQSCTGNDANRGNLSRLSILIYGYTKPKEQIASTSAEDAKDDFEDITNGFRAGLPKANQAMYSLYKKDINTGNLIPPGKLCASTEDCPNMPSTDLLEDSVGPTGYYRWARASDTSLRFKYSISDVDDEINNGFRPTFQIDCQSAPNPKGTANGMNGNFNDPDCQSGHSKVRIHTRYRKLFEGFLTFGLQELDVPDGDEQNALALFYNPKEVGVTGSKNLVGSVDSEIGPLGRNGLPTVKQFKDFRGCYEVDVETNQVSACN
ncbi:hypothetical protein [Methylophilus aquaticus]|uniref:EF-hand domain-containing protein n=1 Tax=Methylophilus aquaticus TaxID=1971610 RepID=A0ABT9JPH7_9PROT|nr:hypothetical protein [Methylophilus aquaticus]MDP8566394.1 hypothetical protein [Methylophilus aquaticus]